MDRIRSYSDLLKPWNRTSALLKPYLRTSVPPIHTSPSHLPVIKALVTFPDVSPFSLPTMMPPPKDPTRCQQPSTTGLGKNFMSPIKHQDKTKTTAYTQPMGRKEEIARLKDKIEKLKQCVVASEEVKPPAVAIPDLETSHSSINDPNLLNEDMMYTPPDDDLPFPLINDIFTSGHTTQAESCLPHRIKPNKAANDLYSNWADLLAHLITPLLKYASKSMGKIPERVFSLSAQCRADGGCTTKTSKGAPIQNAFRRGLGYAAQWYDNLQIRMEEHVNISLAIADVQVQNSGTLLSSAAAETTNNGPTSYTASTQLPLTASLPHATLATGECA
ncbi:hypothetical protein C0993_003653 [Termitomyces sp. T159_Od127]|nr:hypothetical protein C0993_003653 [Termitomyces sp. T159_Od127]